MSDNTQADSQDLVLTDVAFWQGRQVEQQTITPVEPPWYQHTKHLFRQDHRTCLEVGVVPGRFLMFFARELGLDCVGLDYSAHIDGLTEAFRRAGVKGEFIREDFLEWATKRRFDVVFSCGFVEHFTNFDAVIRRHWDLVAPGGLLILSVPILTPLQAGVRKLCYTQAKFQEMLDSHNLSIMDLNELRKAVVKLPGAELAASGCCNEMTIWFGSGDPGVRRSASLIVPMLRPVEFVAKRLRLSSRLFSPECFVAARKPMTDCD